MSQPAVAAAPLPFDLVFSDGEPLESQRHVLQMNLLVDSIRQAMAERGRKDFFVGGNMFVYYSVEQARDVASGRPYFRGPDVFFVNGVDPEPERQAWVAWEEGGRLPEMIVELLSPSTARIDRTVKKDLYAHTFRTPEYYLYDVFAAELEGFHLRRGAYRPLVPNPQGRLACEQLGLELGLWNGAYADRETTWLRLYAPDGRLIPTPTEAEGQRAEAERQRADSERQRADAAEVRAAALEAELARLRARG